MQMLRALSLSAVLAVTSLAPHVATAQPTIAPACDPANLALAVAASNDRDAMHDAVYLALINTSSEACSVPGHPHVSMFDPAGNAAVAGASSPPMLHAHPGPVIVPRTIQPGTSLVTEIRWLRDDGRTEHPACSRIATIALEGARAALDTTVCAADAPGARPVIDVKLYTVAS